MTQSPVTAENNEFPAMNSELASLEIPLKQLLAWNQNVRTTGADNGIEKLAASIASVGLLQSLVVRKERHGKYAVIAGRRRLRALNLLVERGAAESSITVPCRVVTKTADLTEVGLTENAMREPMHPADEFVAFQVLIANGKSVADIAARFGVSEAVVLKRLALARVSPALIQQYREGALNLDVLQAFTLTDDHARQEQIWSDLRQWDRNAQAIRRLLSADDIPAQDKRVRFVGLANYEAAGGSVRRDLFAQEEQGAYVMDADRLTRMVNEELDCIAAQVTAEGWQWVHVQPEADFKFTAQMRRLPPETEGLTAEQESEIARLEEERLSLEEMLEAHGDGDDPLYQELDALEERIGTIQSSRRQTYSDAVKAACGAVISLGWSGEAQITYGLLRPEDDRTVVHSPDRSSSDEPPTDEAAEPASPAKFSATLVEFLTQQKTAAIAAELSSQPVTALAAVVHALALSQFGFDLHLYRTQTSLQITATMAHLEQVQDSPAVHTLAAQREAWLRELPRTSSNLWRWCVAQNQETLLNLLAFCSAMAVNAVRTKADTENDVRQQHADALATALGMDMSRWFTPTADNFYRKISKPQILTAMKEAGVPSSGDVAARLKKAEFVELAERTIQGTGWLPKPLRVCAEQEAEIDCLPYAESAPPLDEVEVKGEHTKG